MGHSTELVQSQTWKHLEMNVFCMYVNFIISKAILVGWELHSFAISNTKLI